MNDAQAYQTLYQRALEERDLAIKQRDAARKERDGMVQRRYRWKEAQEAAETYWEAWQDAVVYWKGERDELREQVDRLTSTQRFHCGLVEVAKEKEQEIDRLRAALEKYGRHRWGCDDHRRREGTCNCGLDEALKGAEDQG